MDYLEYQDYLEHKLNLASLRNKTAGFGSRIKKRISGAKSIGSHTTSGYFGSGSSGSSGGKTGRKWKNHKYIAIVNGRYIYPAKKAAKEAFSGERPKSRKRTEPTSSGGIKKRGEKLNTGQVGTRAEIFTRSSGSRTRSETGSTGSITGKGKKVYNQAAKKASAFRAKIESAKQKYEHKKETKARDLGRAQQNAITAKSNVEDKEYAYSKARANAYEAKKEYKAKQQDPEARRYEKAVAKDQYGAGNSSVVVNGRSTEEGRKVRKKKVENNSRDVGRAQERAVAAENVARKAKEQFDKANDYLENVTSSKSYQKVQKSQEKVRERRAKEAAKKKKRK